MQLACSLHIQVITFHKHLYTPPCVAVLTTDLTVDVKMAVWSAVLYDGKGRCGYEEG